VNSRSMTQAQVQALLRQSAAPLAEYAAASPARKEGAQFVVRTLWTAMIGGPEMEEATWRSFRRVGHLPDDELKAIQECYYRKMKPAVTQEQLNLLRKRYRLRRKR